jgi:hypothetical protein
LQQFSATSPQVPPQLLALHTPRLPGQATPGPVQVLFRQQPPPVQVLLSQQGCVLPPQAWQVGFAKPVQMLPALQVLLAQQACVSAPHGPQVPPKPEQTKPVLHCWFAQQGSPLPPQVWQVALAPPVQYMPALHCGPGLAAQQGSPLFAPQEMQLPLLHRALAPQVLPAQQVSPAAPQAVQVLVAEQTCVALQGWPTAPQAFCAGLVRLQQPVLHLSPVQQGWPAPPHPAQVLSVWHRSPAAQTPVTGATHRCVLVLQHPVPQASPAQHGWPGVPQDRQLLPWQMVPVPHTLLAQQGPPAAPQAAQLAPLHTVSGAEQVWPGQQAAPTPPQLAQAPAVHLPPLVPQFAPSLTQVPA